MLYGMQYSAGVFLLILLALASGCTSPSSGPADGPITPAPTVLPTPENPVSTISLSEMALQLSDMQPDYVLRDRSVMIAPEVTQISKDLGWLQGYFVTFDRTGRSRNDQTRVRQSISVFPVENLKKVFTHEKIAIEGMETMMSSPYEIPFPSIGDRSIAYRLTDTPEPGQVTYTVLFTKKNIYEKITMAGTSTDYETLKDLVQKAASKIQ